MEIRKDEDRCAGVQTTGETCRQKADAHLARLRALHTPRCEAQRDVAITAPQNATVGREEHGR